MTQAIIDIGSNSMRLTVYDINENNFRILFKEKIMAGLAGYVEDGVLSAEGIESACSGLLEFREILESLHIGHIAVFATASLRNIKNTEEAVSSIKTATGYDVAVISGEEEAFYGYTGAMRDIALSSGAFIDIGGASTEIVTFAENEILSEASFPVGSLSLYKTCVKKILPGQNALKKIETTISETIDRDTMDTFGKRTPLVCVGGTARSVLKLAKKRYQLPADCNTVTAAQLNDLCSFFYEDKNAAADLILKLAPDRIHTLIPGMMILQHICQHFDADEIIISKYGTREGYLCRNIL